MSEDTTSAKKIHQIPVGSLVEINEGPNAGLRLWVTEHVETTLGSPLYNVGVRTPDTTWMVCLPAYEFQLRVIHVPDPILDEAINCNQTESC